MKEVQEDKTTPLLSLVPMERHKETAKEGKYGGSTTYSYLIMEH
jgi:hypothetical protein